MKKTPKVYAHASYVGTTGYNNHTRDFFRHLQKHVNLKVRNFTIGKNWDWPNDEPHKEDYINEVDKKLLVDQTLWTGEDTRDEFPIYKEYPNDFKHNVNLVLEETNHHYFYDSYNGPKIAYNVWESTLQPEGFFNKLLEYDQLWFPSQWQADCTIAQGADPNKVKVVPEGVDTKTFYPEDPQTTLDYVDGRFKFIIFGRWDYRKSTKEMIETFLKEFKPNEPVDLIVSIDNPFSGDNFKTTEERLEHYGFTDERIKLKHFPSREDYITYMKNGHVFLSCARSEGWNLPLIEAMACGTPAIYSACCAQMEFAKNKGLPVKVIGEKPALDANYNHYNTVVGNYYEPDFEDLARVMRDSFENYTDYKKRALEEAKLIHRDFNWDRIGEIGAKTLQEFIDNHKEPEDTNTININYIGKPKVEILGNVSKEYEVEFINRETNEVIHKQTISNNMWTACSKEYYIPWLIKINGKEHSRLELEGQRVLISLDSNSLGDTIGWTPYAVEFAKKHKCKVILSTFHNDWFKLKYPNIEFTPVGSELDSIYAIYKIGWFYKDCCFNTSHHPTDFKSQPLQKTATDILGLKYKEVLPKIKSLSSSPIKEKYVTLSIQSTCQAKYWNHPTGWNQVVKYLQSKGYKVAVVDKYRNFGINNFMNASPQCDYHFHNKPLEEVMEVINGAEFHIGIGSGLSWISWALNIPTVLISSFSKPWCEFQTNCIRIYNESPTSGYFNTHRLDASDWNWYPFQKIKSIEDWFEIETITPDLVIEGIDRIL